MWDKENPVFRPIREIAGVEHVEGIDRETEGIVYPVGELATTNSTNNAFC